MRGQLVVSEPDASSPLDSDRIVIRTGPQSLALLKDTQWVDPLPKLVQAKPWSGVSRPAITGYNFPILKWRRSTYRSKSWRNGEMW